MSLVTKPYVMFLLCTPPQAPLRESAIQVLTESLLHHTDNIDVVQAACQLIATVAEVMVHIPSWCLEQGKAAFMQIL